MKKYGWYITIVEVAKCGLFSIAGMNAIQSAEKANLYEVMTYLSLQADINKVNDAIANKRAVQNRNRRGSRS
jgi:hypothetical protein